MKKRYKKVNKKVTITFDERHLPVIVRALEGFMRFRSGQIEMALDEFYADKQVMQMKDKNYNHIDLDKDIETLIRKTYFPELEHPSSALGVGQYGFGGEDAYAISKTLRQYLAYERNDGYRGWGVDFDGYTGGYSPVPKPEIHDFSTRKFFQAPKHIQNKLVEFVEKKEYREAYDLIEKKWKSLPDGDKYEIGYLDFGPIGVWVTAPRKKEKSP
jgi:hypothetical protein